MLDSRLREVRRGVDELRSLTSAIAERVAMHAELGRDVERLQTAVRAMDEVAERVGSTLHGTSAEEIAHLRHDLRMHLATYKGYVELLVEELQDRRADQELDLRVFEEARQMSDEMLLVITGLRHE